MTTRTIADLCRAVLTYELGFAPQYEDPAAVDVEFVKRKYATKYDKLVDEGLAYWPVGEIPGAAFDDLARVVATECAPSYGVPYDKLAQGMAELRRHVAKRASTRPTEIMSF